MPSGIYKIVNKINGKCYIGSAVDLIRRHKRHFSNLNRNVHINAKLQNAWNKYEANNFEFCVIAFCEPGELLALEQKCIYEYDCVTNGYNIALTAGNVMQGRNHSQESKNNISKNNGRAKLGSKLTEEHKDLLRKVNTGNKNAVGSIRTKEQRENHAAKLKGRIGPNKGRKFSEETKLKMRLGQLGKKRSLKHIENSREGLKKAWAEGRFARRKKCPSA